MTLRVDGRPVALRLAPGGRLSHPPGQGGLRTTRVELDLDAPAHNARAVALRDATFPGRVGWRAVVVAPGRGTAVRSSVPAEDPTARPAPLPARAAREPVARDARRGSPSRPARAR